MTANGTQRLRVVVVDGDEGARRRLRALLESIESVDAIEEAASAPQAARRIEALRPDSYCSTSTCRAPRASRACAPPARPASSR